MPFPLVYFDVGTVYVEEGVGSFEHRLYLSAPSADLVTVIVRPSFYRADDMDVADITVVFQPGVTEAVFRLSIREDTLDEPAEIFALTLVSATNAAIDVNRATTYGYIVDNDVPPGPLVFFDGISVNVDEGSGFAEHRLFLSAPAVAPVTVTVRISPFRAGDMDVSDVTVVFQPGETVAAFRIPITEDMLDEPTEFYTLTLASATNAAIDLDRATTYGYIIDNDETAGPLAFFEGGAVYVDEGASFSEHVVHLSGPVDEVVSLVIRPSSFRAGDMDVSDITVTFQPGQTSATFRVPILDDVTDEADEIFALEILSATNAGIDVDRSIAYGYIVDNDLPAIIVPTAFVTAPLSVREGDGTITLGLTLANMLSATGTVLMSFTAAGSTATEGVDVIVPNYVSSFSIAQAQPKDYALSLPPITILQDGLPEGTETLAVTIRVTGQVFANGNDTMTVIINLIDKTTTGTIGHDLLTGLGLGDQLYGLAGDDVYVIANANDVPIERPNEGRDEVRTSLPAFTLGNDLEDLTGTAPGGQFLTGNLLGNSLSGSSGNDTLSGGEGRDRLTGGGGDDLFRDTTAGLNGDTITDFSVGDRIIFTDANRADFGFSLVGQTLTYSGGTLTLYTASRGHLVASPAAAGGVEVRFAIPPYAQASGDFDGDGKDDLAWRHLDGTITNWLGEAGGSFLANRSATFPLLPFGWMIVASARFNDDAFDDLLLRSGDGAVITWFGQTGGGFAIGSGQPAVVPRDWRISGTGDVNGDRIDDILWRHESGVLTAWLGTAEGSFTPHSSLMASVPTDWTIVGVSDFNGDGFADILWRHDSGAVTGWLSNSNGDFVANAGFMAAVPPDWEVVGTGDFNGDGLGDVLWRHATGPLTTWVGTPGGDFVASSIWADVPNDWQVAAIGDYDGDGRDDVLWRHDTGVVTSWKGLPSGDFLPNGGFMATVDNGWLVAPTGALWA